MDKHIFVINGSGGVGKDEFVDFVSLHMRWHIKKSTLDPYVHVMNFSSIDRINKICKEIGWNGKKTEKYRKFASELKSLLTWYDDIPFKDMKAKVEEFIKSDANMLFLHIREPHEIDRACKAFNAKSILVKRDSVKQITSNSSDKNVFNYDYDITIENNGSLNDLEQKAIEFIKRFMVND